MKLGLSFKRLQVNNNNINPRNLLSKAGPERGVAELRCYWRIQIMCCAWQTHLGRRKTLAKSSNRNLQIQQLLSSLVQGFRELDHRVFVAEGTWAAVLWFGDWKNTFAMWIFELVDVSSFRLITAFQHDHQINGRCNTTNDQFREKLSWRTDNMWVTLIKPRLVAGQQTHLITCTHAHFNNTFFTALILQASI